MFGVPRIFERTYGAIVETARAAGGVKALVVPWALVTGGKYQRALAAGHRPSPAARAQYALARALVLRRLPPLLGCDRLRFFASGSAALQPDVGHALAAAGIAICEGYGLTECSPVVTANDPRAPRIGTVGRAIPGVELKLGDDGELFVRGPGVMLGYYEQPDETRAVLRDGWLATGDIATIDGDGFVRIVDRKRELFKTSGGKYVAPARVESALLRSPYIAQAVVLGSDRPHPAALISPNWTALRGALRVAADASPERLAPSAEVRAFLAAEAARATSELGDYEQIRWIGVLPRDLTIDDGELTPTLKVKRRAVEDRWAHLVPEYAAAAPPY
jgi:long-chain acyl-CoA synthetase